MSSLHLFSMIIRYLTLLSLIHTVQPTALLSLGCSHQCILSTTHQQLHEVYCWGDNTYGQCGYDVGEHAQIHDIAISQTLGPMFVSNESIAVLHTGCTHTCVVMKEGTGQCWGRTLTIPAAFKHDWFHPACPQSSLAVLTPFFVCTKHRNTSIDCWGDEDLSGDEMTALLRQNSACAQSASRFVQTASASPSPVESMSLSASESGSASLSPLTTLNHATETPSNSLNATLSASASYSATPTTLPTMTDSVTASPSVSSMAIASGSPSTSASESVTITSTQSLTASPSTTASESVSSTSTGSITVSPTVSPHVNVTRVIAGGANTCALFPDGRAKCWGNNDGGQLGLGTIGGRYDSAAAVSHITFNGRIADLALGGAHVCAILDNGDVTCWGANDRGQLGCSGQIACTAAVSWPAGLSPVTLAGRVSQVSAAGMHTCALYTNGSVKCWGANDYGQLGYTTAGGEIADPASKEFIPLAGNVSQLRSGYEHTCALLHNGSVRCWGQGYYGQLGYKFRGGSMSSNLLSSVGYVPVNGGPVSQLSAAGWFTCALRSNGSVRCWGQNWSGQVGCGMVCLGDVYEPTTARIPSNLGPVAQLVMGHDHTCALFSNGSVKCWGSNVFGQVGCGAARDVVESPDNVTFVPLHGVVRQLTAGAHHNCATYNNGSVKCWGWNIDGQLGYGILDDVIFSPEEVGFLQL